MRAGSHLSIKEEQENHVRHTIHLPRQYLSQPPGGVRDERPYGEAGACRKISDRLRRHQPREREHVQAPREQHPRAKALRLRRHAEQLAAGGVPFLLRMPIIPGVNDTPFHFETAAELVKNSKSLVRVDVLPYQRAAGAKYEMVGREYAPGFDESVPPRFHTEIFDRMGIPYRVF